MDGQQEFTKVYQQEKSMVISLCLKYLSSEGNTCYRVMVNTGVKKLTTHKEQRRHKLLKYCHEV